MQSLHLGVKQCACATRRHNTRTISVLCRISQERAASSLWDLDVISCEALTGMV